MFKTASQRPNVTVRVFNDTLDLGPHLIFRGRQQMPQTSYLVAMAAVVLFCMCMAILGGAALLDSHSKLAEATLFLGIFGASVASGAWTLREIVVSIAREITITQDGVTIRRRLWRWDELMYFGGVEYDNVVLLCVAPLDRKEFERMELLYLTPPLTVEQYTTLAAQLRRRFTWTCIRTYVEPTPQLWLPK